MSRSFERSFKKLIGIEGGYSDHPQDPGKKTKYGITEAVARESGFTGDMKDLTLEFAKSIYKEKYWDISKLTSVSEFSEDLAFKLFEVSVNCGVRNSIRFFQRALNALNKNGELYDDLKVDGILGEKTLSSFRSFYKARIRDGASVLIASLNGQQVSYYIAITEKNEDLRSFYYGWIKNRILK